MLLNTHDLHVELDRTARRCKVYGPGGHLVLDVECRNRTVNDLAPPSARYAPCPPGEFILARPVPKNTPPFGPWFVLLEDYDGHHAMADNHRGGIGCHGGGSGLADWNAPRQSAFVWTLGCWRFMNVDLDELVRLVHASQGAGGTVYVTVAPFTVGTPGSGGPKPTLTAGAVPDVDTPVDELDPDE